MLLFYNRNTR